MASLHRNLARAGVLVGVTALALAAVHHQWLRVRAYHHASAPPTLPGRIDLAPHPAHRLAANAATSAVAPASVPAPFVGPPAPLTTITYDSGSPATYSL